MSKRNILIRSFTILFTLLLCNPTFSQSLINGDFEDNNCSTEGGNYLHLTDEEFNELINNVVAYGLGYASGGNIGELDLMHYGYDGGPQNGEWCIGMAAHSLAQNSDEFSIELDTNLIVGEEYQVIFHAMSNTNYVNGGSYYTLGIGESLNDSTFGNLIVDVQPDINLWGEHTYFFLASQNSKYITVRANLGGPESWIKVDNFTINSTLSLSIDEQFSKFSIYPNPASSLLNISIGEFVIKAKISVFNFQGNLLISDEIIQSNQHQVDLSSIPAGVYFIQIASEKATKRMKFIKK